ncbi:histidine phosphatase superfamily [Desarmillaria tabescens]|uniref:Phytase A n=1 Tax=Armillaria tabescens TaxID=1929756 RepID=A0AA39JMC4_ARMTA|nr:histidine phosphatase superfamily [Desarmillaria tabescens]KAK0443979.1 histidine phosphatase superfamily [Desarmillaria tabescens]
MALCLPVYSFGSYKANLSVVPFAQNWAQYSPFVSLAEYQVPSGCVVTQVNLLERHGARYPTVGSAAGIISAINKLTAVGEFTNERMQFLANYTYDLGVADLLPFGAAQQTFFQRYSYLIDQDQIPFVRASGSDRVIKSATNWTAGFSAASYHVYNPSLSVILSEEASRNYSNDTLDDNLCENAGDSDDQTNTWLAIYAPTITARINEGAPGANVSDADTYSLLSMCPFDSVAKEKRSPFCDMFEAADFGGFEYSGDLDKYYGTGYGQELGPVQGVGYVNELLARLTSSPVQDSTQTNHTLDSNSETFPLNRTFYADFSHDNQMIAIYSAMGLFPQSANLDPTKPDPSRTWLASRLVSFSANMVTEKLECSGEEYVRVLVNDAVQPLAFCGSGDGLCSLDAFVESQSYARNNGDGDWEKCFS